MRASVRVLWVSMCCTTYIFKVLCQASLHIIRQLVAVGLLELQPQTADMSEVGHGEKSGNIEVA